MLLALGANEMGSLFGPVPGARAFHWVFLYIFFLGLLLGLGEWACTRLFFKPNQKSSYILVNIMYVYYKFIVLYEVFIF